MNDDARELRNSVLLAIAVILAIIAFLEIVGECKADCICEFTAPARCAPCRAMQPIVAELKAQKYDIRVIDVDQQPDVARAYHVRGIPCFVYVHEAADGRCYERGRIVGQCSEGQLRRLAAIPAITTVGAWGRNVVRALFSPTPLLEW